jgi:hypothetical protein
MGFPRLRAKGVKLGARLDDAQPLAGINKLFADFHTVPLTQPCPVQLATTLVHFRGETPSRVVRVFPHGSTNCDRAFQHSTGVHGLLQNPDGFFGIWIAK